MDLQAAVGMELGNELFVRIARSSLHLPCNVLRNQIIVLRAFRYIGEMPFAPAFTARVVRLNQVLDMELQAVQQAVGQRLGGELLVLFFLMRLRLAQGIEKIAPLLAPGRQQRMPLQRQIRFIAALQDLRGFQQVAPIQRARVERENMHVAVQRNLLEQGHIHRRQRAQTEHEQTRRQAADTPLRQRVHQRVPQLNAVQRIARTAVQFAPKHRLPGLLVLIMRIQRRHAPSGAPRLNPIGAVHQILVEHIGNLTGQMVARQAAFFQVIVQHAAHAGKRIVLHEFGRLEQLQQPPLHDFAGERAHFRHVGFRLAHQLPRQTGRQAELQVGGNAQMPCPKLVDIAAHALALHHNVLGGQRIGQGVFVLH